MKSLQRVPMPRTRSASRASALAAVVPVTPIAPTRAGGRRAASPCRPASPPRGSPVASASRAARRSPRRRSSRRRRRSAAGARRAAARPPRRARSGSARRAAHVPHAAREERLRPVERLGLDVLGQRQRHGAGLGRVGEHAHRGQQRATDSCSGRLMRSQKRETGLKQSLTDTSSEPGPRAPAAPGSRRAWRRCRRQQQHRQAVDRRERRAGDHVGRAGADRGRAGDVARRLRMRAKPAAAWTIACSLRAW